DPAGDRAGLEPVEHVGDFVERAGRYRDRIELARAGELDDFLEIRQRADIGALHADGALCHGDRGQRQLAAEQTDDDVETTLAQGVVADGRGGRGADQVDRAP